MVGDSLGYTGSLLKIIYMNTSISTENVQIKIYCEPKGVSFKMENYKKTIFVYSRENIYNDGMGRTRHEIFDDVIHTIYDENENLITDRKSYSRNYTRVIIFENAEVNDSSERTQFIFKKLD